MPTKWSETENIRWKAEIPGRGWSSPVIADGKIWLTTAIERELAPDLKEKIRADKLAANPMKAQMSIVGEILLRLVCVDAATGDLLREIELFNIKLPQSVHQLNSYASPTPVWNRGCVFCHFGTYGTCCYDIAADKVTWRRELALEHAVGPGSSPVLVAERLIIPCDGIDRQFVTALDAETGDEVWRTPRPKMTGDNGDFHKAFSSPLVINVGGQDQVVIIGAQWVVSYAPDTGREIWKVNHGRGFSNVAAPVFGHGKIFMSTGYTRPEFWAIRADGAGDVTGTHVAWKTSKQIPTMPSPLLVADRVYIVNDQGVATCLDATSGDQHWQKRIDGNYSASPLFAAGKIYFCNREGKITVLADGKDYQEVAANHLDGQILASPAVLDQALILRTDTHLYRIEAGK